VVAGGDDDQEHEHGIRQCGSAHRARASEPQQPETDDQRIAEVHARHRREGVVERVHQPVVEIDASGRDRVDDAELGEARWRSRVHDEDD
jgi:hypothetical protein